jgi:C-terminal processing protease CtpA/Prc
MYTGACYLRVGLLVLIGFAGASYGPRIDPEVENLRAFAKLYGYVRFFHPSDEAASVDWDRFAIYGADRVAAVGSREELHATLEELFLPIAPTVQVFPTSEPPEPLSLAPEDTAGLEVVAWQHVGVGLSPRSIYRSKRLNRELEIIGQSSASRMLTGDIAAVAHRGKRVKLRAYVRTEVTGGNQAQLWLRVDRMSDRTGFFDNMSDRPITASDWQLYEIEGPVAEDATAIAFGCFIVAEGRAWVDDVVLQVQSEGGEWEPVEISNPGFEDGEEGRTAPGCYTGGRLTRENPHGGEQSLLLQEQRAVLTEPAFDAHPEVGELVEKEIGAGLSSRVPLALFSEARNTLGPESPRALSALLAALERVEIDSLTADSESVRLADIIIAWNVFQHFYPYFDVVDVDWEAQLTRSLEAARADTSAREFYYTLGELVANLRDGHGSVYHPDFRRQGCLPLVYEWIEGRVVVTRSRHGGIEPGDIVERLDGLEAERATLDAERYISGSPQWKRFRAMRSFGCGDVGTTAELVLRRGDEVLELQVERQQFDRSLYESEGDPIRPLEDGVYYVDLSRAEMTAISERIAQLAGARGVVFDLRGYPNGNHQVISHLLSSPDTSTAWMRVPHIIYPDQENIVEFGEFGWQMPALEPHIAGKVVFITDGRAISYAESFMGFIEGYKLAEIVGQPTAGTNGNVNPLMLPGGFRVNWTGMKVVKHDGSQHHLIGILPTVPAERTIQGVIDGRDEFLEEALEITGRG